MTSIRCQARLPRAAIFTLWASVLLAPDVHAQSAAKPVITLATAPAKAPATVEARDWLARIHDAARRSNYRGTMVLAAGGAMSSSRVWHYFLGQQTYERMEALDGRQQRVYRVNDEVHTVWPQERVALVERRDALSALSTTPQAVDPRALEHYDLKREGLSRVAGREAQVFVLEPRDDLRYAQRLWADRATGLMLRADVLGPGSGALRPVLESAAFSEIEIGMKAPADAHSQAVPRLEGFLVQRPQSQRTQLDAEGWTLASAPVGFRLTVCMKRAIEVRADRAPGDEPVLQAMFTDGLAHISLFIEPHDPRRLRHEMQAHQGATSTVVMRRDDHWITAVGDAPVATLRQLASALERRR